MNQYEIYEKKQLNKYSLVIGGVLLFSYLIQQGLSTVIVVFLSLIGYTSQEINVLLLDPWFAYLINSFLLLITCVFPFCLLKFLCKKPISIIGSFNSPRKFCFKSCVVFAFSLSFVANLVTSVFNLVLERVFDFEAIVPEIGTNTSDDLLEFIFIMICSAVVPALVEEFAFRGMVLGALRKFGDWPAILISSLIFAVFHGNFIQIPFAFIVGIGLGIVVVISGSIWTSVFVHFLINAYALIANKFIYAYPEIIAKLFIAFIAIGMFSLIYLFKNGAFKLFEKKKISLSSSSKFLKILFSPTIIIFIVIMIFIALQYKV